MPDFKRLTEMMQKTWPYPFVLRKDVHKASGGVFTGEYLKTLDHRNQGPEGRFNIGKAVAYEKGLFYQWFLERMS